MIFKVVIVAAFVVLCSTAYSELLGEKLCSLSLASYCKPSDVQSWSCAPCKTALLDIRNVHTFVNSSMDTLGFIATSSELRAIVLVFRGTLPWDIKNWISDINFLTTNYPLCNNGCKVHSGFYSAFSDIKKQVLDTVQSYKQKYGLTDVVVTGHSLGAAIATHAVAYLIANQTKVTQFYTYGSPRVGDPKFSSWFNTFFGSGSFKARVTHHRDPVPHLPMSDWGFMHVPTEVFYNGTVKQGAYICQDNLAEDGKCSDQYYLDTSVPDHLSYYDVDFAGTILKCQ